MITATHTASEQLIPIGLDGWRLVSASGTIRGHIRVQSTPTGDRFLARRFDAASGSFRVLGTFWSRQEAQDCLRWS